MEWKVFFREEEKKRIGLCIEKKKGEKIWILLRFFYINRK